MLNERNTLLEDDGIEEEILVEEECSVAQAVWGDIQGDIENQTDLQNALDAKQDSLTESQLNAVNSGITAEKVTTYDGYADQIASKADQSALNAESIARGEADTALGRRIDDEATARQQADNGLQSQIDAITSKSDVVDVVANYAALQAYDTSSLGNNDVVKVLDDETHEDALTYYRWSTTTQTWSYIGQEAPYYSKGQMDVMLQGKQDKLTAGTNIQIQNGTISATDTTYTAGNGLNLNGTEFSADTTVLATKSDLDSYYTKTETDTKLAPKLEAEVVAELPSTGTEGKLYLTPKNYTRGTGTGNPIEATITDEAGKMESLKLDGDTFQQTYTGQNLYDVAGVSSGTYITKDDDGWITITRDNTSGDSTVYTNVWTSNLALETSTQYKIFIEVKAVSGTGSLFITSTNSTQGQFNSWQEKKLANMVAGQTYTVAPTTKSSFSGISQGLRTVLEQTAGQGGSVTFRLSVCASSTPTETFSYEPYTGGQPSPNPDYPQQIQTVTGVQTVTVAGKNLYNVEAIPYVPKRAYSATGEVYSWTDYTGTDEYQPVEPNTEYTLWNDKIGNTTYLCEYDENKNFIQRLVAVRTFTTTATTKYLRWSLNVGSGEISPTKTQLELGSTATSYEPYHTPTSYPINLGSIELCKLGDYQDYIWKDGDDWKIHKEISKVMVDGTIGAISSPSANRFNIDNLITNYKKRENSLLALCDRYITIEQAYNNAQFDSLASNYECCIDLGCGAANVIRFKNTKISTSSDFAAALEANPLTLYYVLATPTYITITDTTLIAQLEAIRTASLQNGANTITNTATGSNLAGDMEIGYFGFNPNNRYDKWLWLDINNNYEQIGS